MLTLMDIVLIEALTTAKNRSSDLQDTLAALLHPARYSHQRPAQLSDFAINSHLPRRKPTRISIVPCRQNEHQTELGLAALLRL